MPLPLHVQYLYKLLGFLSVWDICVFSPFKIYSITYSSMNSWIFILHFVDCPSICFLKLFQLDSIL